MDPQPAWEVGGLGGMVGLTPFWELWCTAGRRA